jgi:hypothetical protein
VEETGKMVHYEPDHQDADWGGFVAISSRKHVQEQNHGGGGDKDEWKPSKRQLNNNKSNGSTLDLIGGPEEGLCPRNWQSEAQAASVRSKTSVDQLTDRGRSQIQIRYSNRQLGKQASTDSVAASLSGEDPFRYLLNETPSPRRGKENFIPLCEDPQFSLIGYRHTGRTSLLSGLGKDIFTDSPSLVEKANVNLS